METTLIAFLFILHIHSISWASTLEMHTNLFFGIGEELTDVLFRSTDVLVQNLRTVDDLGLTCVEHLADLSCHERLASTRRTKEEDTLDMRDTKLVDEARWEDTRGESATEDRAELRVETTDAHVLELEVRCEDRVWRWLPRAGLELDRAVGGLHDSNVRLLHNDPVMLCAGALSRELYDLDTLDGRLECLAMELEEQDLPSREDEAVERANEVLCHLICGKDFCNLQTTLEETDLYVQGLKVWR